MAKQTFTTGQVLTAAQMTSLQQTAMGGGSTTAKTSSYTLVAADVGTVVQMNSASATTITVNTALFAAGDTVQIQNIGAGICTITAGTATVNTAGSLALSQWEGGQLYFTSASASVFFDVVQTGGGGKVLQVIQQTESTAVANSTTTFADTGTTLSITPSSATSKVLVILSQSGFKNSGNANNGVDLKLLRGATELWRQQYTLYTNSSVASLGLISVSYLDSPATTSATTYKTQFANMTAAASVGINQNGAGGSLSTIILMEIGA